MLNQLRDVFASLHAHEVRYVTIGGIAAVLHGVPRATFDLGILIEASPENAEALLAALRDTGLATAELIDANGLLEQAITVFNDRVRIGVQTKTPGLEFDSAWRNRVELAYRGRPLIVVSRDDLIRSKRAAGRPVDRDDVRALEAGGTGDS
jgi:hypothetical protein